METCQRLASAIQPNTYKVAICSAFKQGRGIGKQQVAILAKEDAQAAWAEREYRRKVLIHLGALRSHGYKINGKEIAVYSGRNQSITSRQRWPVRTTGDRTPAEVPDGGLTHSRIEQNVIGLPVAVDVGGASQHPAQR